jgi:hypothetical protein
MPCWEVTFAVLWPVVPPASSCWSTSATERPAWASSSAVVTPVIPPPMTTAS